MMKSVKKALPYLIAGFFPMLALAATIGDIVTKIEQILGTVIPILLLVGTVVFLWGVITYLTAGGDEEKQSYGKYLIIYGLVGLFAMVAIWGIVRVLTTTFGVGGQGIPTNVGEL